MMGRRVPLFNEPTALDGEYRSNRQRTFMSWRKRTYSGDRYAGEVEVARKTADRVIYMKMVTSSSTVMRVALPTLQTEAFKNYLSH